MKILFYPVTLVKFSLPPVTFTCLNSPTEFNSEANIHESAGVVNPSVVSIIDCKLLDLRYPDDPDGIA